MSAQAKVLLTIGLWVVVTMVVAIGAELLFGIQKPGLTAIVTLAICLPVLRRIWKPRATAVHAMATAAPVTPTRSRRIVRELTWFIGSALAFAVFVVAVVAYEDASGDNLFGSARWPRADEFFVAAAVLYGFVSTVRLVRFAMTTDFEFVATYWREALIVVGVCALAYGWSAANYSSDEQPWIVLGAGVAAVGVVALLRQRK